MHWRHWLLYDIHQTRILNYILLSLSTLNSNEHSLVHQSRCRCLDFLGSRELEDSHSFSLALQQTPGKEYPEHLMKYNESVVVSDVLLHCSINYVILSWVVFPFSEHICLKILHKLLNRLNHRCFVQWVETSFNIAICTINTGLDWTWDTNLPAAIKQRKIVQMVFCYWRLNWTFSTNRSTIFSFPAKFPESSETESLKLLGQQKQLTFVKLQLLIE